MERNPWFSALIVLLALIAGWYLAAELWALATRFSDILLLFFLAWLLAFILKPVAYMLHRRIGLPRAAAIAVVYLGLILVVLVGTILLIPLITLQLSQLGASLSFLGDQVPAWVVGLQGELLKREINVDISGFYRQQDLSNQTERVVTLLIQNAIGIVTGIASTMLGIILMLVLSFYIMLDGGRLLRQITGAVPHHVREELRFLFESIDRTFGGFIRGQLIQCAIYGVGTAIIMYVAGLNFILVSSLFAAVIMLVPFLGPMLAVVPPVLIAALQGSWATVIGVAIGLFLMQQLVINVIAPKLLSEAVGLPPLLVILAMLFGAKIAGVVGAIFGVPFAAVIYAMLLFLYRRSSLAENAVGSEPDTPRPSEMSTVEVPANNAPWLAGPTQWLGRQLGRMRGRNGAYIERPQ